MQEIRYELTLDASADTSYILADLQWSGQWAWNDLAPEILALLRTTEPQSLTILDRLLSILQGSDIADHDLEALAREKCATVAETDHLARWCAVLTGVAPGAGVPTFRASLESLSEAERVTATMTFITKIWGGRFEEKSHVRGAFRTAIHLKELYLLAHTYVRAVEDLKRTNGGVYSPELRDHAQDARDRLFELLRDIPGKEAFLAIAEIAALHPDEAARPWMLHYAKSKAEADGDSAAWSAQQVIDFERQMERTPANHRELAELAVLRLLDFRDDVENGDESIARVLQRIPLETEMRNYIARELRSKAAGRYSIAQEEELADAKRTDIRFLGAFFDAPVPAELKIADGWTGPQLLERLENQLCGDYLRDSRSRRGIFVLVNQGTKAGWDIPDAANRVDFPGLVEALTAHWQTALSPNLPDIDDVVVVGIDLRTRFT